VVYGVEVPGMRIEHTQMLMLVFIQHIILVWALCTSRSHSHH
jgi:hypothetical protein